MRPRDKILRNLDEIYEESFARAKKGEDQNRMADLDCSYVRDQLLQIGRASCRERV